MIAWEQIGLSSIFLTSDMAGNEDAVEEPVEADETEAMDAAEEPVEADETEGADASDEEVADGEEVEGSEEAEGEAVEGGENEGEILDSEAVDGEGMEEGAEMGDMEGMGDELMEGTTTPKDPLLSNVVFVGGISVGVFIVGGLLGLLLAKKKIKKGIELYEDY